MHHGFCFVLLIALFCPPVIGTGWASATNGAAIAGSSGLPPTLVLVSPHNEYRGFFGYSVAIDRPSNSVLVGSAETINGEQYAGRVYLINSSSGSEIIEYKGPEAQKYADFGQSVAVGGNLVLIGAPYGTAEDKLYAGRAYLFNEETGALIHSFASPHPKKNSYFGGSVAICCNDKLAIVGAGLENVNGVIAAGRVYIFNVTDGSLVRELISPNSQLASEFGFSIASSGNVLVVGARGETAGGYSQDGRAYVFNARTGALLETLVSPNPSPEGGFGTSVALDSKLTAIGASGETGNKSSQYYAGHAYVFKADSGALVAKLSSPHPQSYGYFGSSVAISGKLVAVGAYFENSGSYIQAGNAYLFGSYTGALVFSLNDPQRQINGEFGQSIAISGRTILVGAPRESALDVLFSGVSYIYTSP
jgi:hypothetical protein